MRPSLLHPGALFVTALVLLVLAIPLASESRPQNEALRRVLSLHTG